MAEQTKEPTFEESLKKTMSLRFEKIGLNVFADQRDLLSVNASPSAVHFSSCMPLGPDSFLTFSCSVLQPIIKPHANTERQQLDQTTPSQHLCLAE
mmetsp:Transcript_7923/g.9428  ORF Transcript_7923/g.9428 Transcript_7923/m.9428 type:complete len:96 (+) Transcript_7923:68-355(+)